MNENTTPDPAPPAVSSHSDASLQSRRQFLTRLSLGLGGACAAIIGVPSIGFIVAPLFRKAPETWRTVGRPSDFGIGQTINVTFEDPSPLPWAGVTAKAGAWLRREADDRFIAFSVHCTHLGCPVRWMPDAKLFLCPCHGGCTTRTDRSPLVRRPTRCSATMCALSHRKCRSRPPRSRSPPRYEADLRFHVGMDRR